MALFLSILGLFFYSSILVVAKSDTTIMRIAVYFATAVFAWLAARVEWGYQSFRLYRYGKRY